MARRRQWPRNALQMAPSCWWRVVPKWPALQKNRQQAARPHHWPCIAIAATQCIQLDVQQVRPFRITGHSQFWNHIEGRVGQNIEPVYNEESAQGVDGFFKERQELFAPVAKLQPGIQQVNGDRYLGSLGLTLNGSSPCNSARGDWA